MKLNPASARTCAASPNLELVSAASGLVVVAALVVGVVVLFFIMSATYRKGVTRIENGWYESRRPNPLRLGCRQGVASLVPTGGGC